MVFNTMFACGAPNGGHFVNDPGLARGFGEDYICTDPHCVILADGHGGIPRELTEDLISRFRKLISSEDLHGVLQEGNLSGIVDFLTHWVEKIRDIPYHQGTTLSSVSEVTIAGEKRLLLVAWGDSAIVYRTTDGKFHEIGTANADNMRFVERCGDVLSYHYDKGFIPFIRKGGIAYDSDGRAVQKFPDWDSFVQYVNQSGLQIQRLIDTMYIKDLNEFRRRFDAGDLLANPVTRFQYTTLLHEHHDDFRFGCQSTGSGNQINGVPWGHFSLDPLGDEIRHVSPNMGSSFAGGQIGNALGDGQVKALLPKQAAYTPECILLDPSEVENIMIASDGMWDVLTHDEAFSVTTAQEMFAAMNQKMESHMIYSGLVANDVWGKKVWYHDDMSCIRLEISK